MKRFSSIVRVAVCLFACGAWFAATSAVAEDKPVAVVSIAGYDALISDLKYVGPVVGRPMFSVEVEGLLAIFTGGQGLAGLDAAKPIGASITMAEGELPKVLGFVPVTDVKKLLTALQAVVPEVKDLGDGYTQLRPINSPPVVMKTVGGWAFITLTKDDLTDLPADPAALLGDLPKRYDLAVQLNVQNIPESYRSMAVDAVTGGFSERMERLDGEDDATFEARQKIGKKMLDEVVGMIDELDRVTVGAAIDSTTKSIYLDAAATVVAGGKIAGQLAASAESDVKSKLAGFADSDADLDLHLLVPLTADDRTSLESILETSRGEALKRIDAEDSIDDVDAKAALKKMTREVFDVVAATVKEGTVNGGAVVLGDGPYEVVLGATVADGKKLAEVAKQGIELISQAPDFPRDDVKFGTAERDGLTFHTAEFPVDDDAAEFFGDEMTAALGFGEKTVFLALGQKPLETVSTVLAGSKSSVAKFPPFLLQVDLEAIMEHASKADDDVEKIAKLMAEELAKCDATHLNITADYVPNGSRVRIELEEGFITAFGKTVQALQRAAR